MSSTAPTPPLVSAATTTTTMPVATTAPQTFVDPFAANYGKGFQKIPYLDAHALQKLALERERARAREQEQAEHRRRAESDLRMHQYDDRDERRRHSFRDERFHEEYYTSHRDYASRENELHSGYHLQSHAHSLRERESERRYQREEYRYGRERYNADGYQRGYRHNVNYNERNEKFNNHRGNHNDYYNEAGYSRNHKRCNGDYTSHYHERNDYSSRERDGPPRDWEGNRRGHERWKGHHERHSNERGRRYENGGENWNHEHEGQGGHWDENFDENHGWHEWDGHEQGNEEYDTHSGDANANGSMGASNEGWFETANGSASAGAGAGADDQYYEGYESLPTSFGRKRRSIDGGGGDGSGNGNGRPTKHARMNHSKYFHQRYRLFRRFDQGIKLDKVAWYSATPETIAAHIATRFRDCLPSNPTIVDAFCGAAGNVIQFALPSVGAAHVLAVELCAERLHDARHNAKIYQVEHLVDWIHGNAFHILPSLATQAIDAVFLSPPWGGPEYLDAETYDLNLFAEIMKIARTTSPNIAILVPRNIQWQQAIELWGDCEVELNYLHDKLKTVTIYFGELVRQRTTMDSGPSTVELYEDPWDGDEETHGNHQGGENYHDAKNGDNSGTQVANGDNDATDNDKNNGSGSSKIAFESKEIADDDNARPVEDEDKITVTRVDNISGQAATENEETNEIGSEESEDTSAGPVAEGGTNVECNQTEASNLDGGAQQKDLENDNEANANDTHTDELVKADS